MLKTRVITAVFLTIGFLLALFFASKVVWSLLTLLATVIGVWEWSKLIKLKKRHMHIYLAVALAIGLLLIFSVDSPFANYHDELVFLLLGLAAFFWIVLTPIWLISRFQIDQKLLMALLGLVLLLATWVGLNGLQNISH